MLRSYTLQEERERKKLEEDDGYYRPPQTHLRSMFTPVHQDFSLVDNGRQRRQERVSFWQMHAALVVIGMQAD